MSHTSSKQQKNHFGEKFISILSPQKAGRIKNIDANINPAIQSHLAVTRYMPGLDGLRALAVLAVVAYHLGLKWASGGFLGVDLFFVISGYLITDQLVSQWSLTGRIDLKNFWLRRARRLLPALFTVLAGVLLWTAVFDPLNITTLLADELASVFYVSNWWLIFHQVSYFTSFGPPSPLGHLWSLAVEEQFYLVWPLLVWLGLSIVHSRKRIAGLILIGVVISALAMAFVFQPGTDPSRVYYGTDTRAFALLIGAALACLTPSCKVSAVISSGTRYALDIVGGTGLVVVLLMIISINEYQTFLYRGGLLFFSLVSAIVIMVLAHPAGRLSKLFECQPLRWLGVRSYSIYLWHYPVIILTTPSVNTGGPDAMLIFGQLAVSIALAALSYRLIEEPIRRGALKRWMQLQSTKQQKLIWTEGWITSKGAVLILGLSCLAIITMVLFNVKCKNIPASLTNIAQSAQVQPADQEESASSALPVTQIEDQDPGRLDSGQDNDSNSTSASATTSSSAFPANQTETPTETTKPLESDTSTHEAGRGITVIGDSVMVGEKPALEKLLPGIYIDTQVGRQMNQALDLIGELKQQGKLGDRVVIELGTNGTFTYDQLITVLQSLGDVQQIMLVNTRVPRSWEGVVNETLAKAAATYSRTQLIDWYSASQGHNEYFYKDGVHLSPAGIEAYASMIAKALNS